MKSRYVVIAGAVALLMNASTSAYAIDSFSGKDIAAGVTCEIKGKIKSHIVLAKTAEECVDLGGKATKLDDK